MQTEVFETLADPMRLRIVEALRGGEQAVGDIVERLDIHQSGVSRHLRILRRAGFVRVRPSGPRRLYSLRPEPFQELESLGGRLQKALGGPARSFRGRARSQTARASGQTQGRDDMTKKGEGEQSARRRVTLERTFKAPLEDVWELWTTKDGIESWWGPDGFRVEVHTLELRPGGKLVYDMIADRRPSNVEFLKKAGMPPTHAAHATYTEVTPMTRLAYLHAADFIPGVEPYDVQTLIELFPSDGQRENGALVRRDARRVLDEHGDARLGNRSSASSNELLAAR